MRSWASSVSPSRATWWIAVRPSAMAAFTSAPFRSRVRSAALSFAATASRTLVGDPAKAPAAKAARTTWRTTVFRRGVIMGWSSGGHGVEIEGSRAVAEGLQVVEAEGVEHAQHDVRHGRLILRLQVKTALEAAGGVSEQDQGAPPVVVQVRVPHGRPVQDHGVLEQVALAVRSRLQLVQEVRKHADVVLVDLGEV